MRKPLLILSFLVLCPVVGLCQGVPVNIPPVFRLSGGTAQPAGGATVSFCQNPAVGNPCTNFASAFSDVALTQAINQTTNPIKTDGLGNVPLFYAAAGIYTYTISGAGITTPNGPYFWNVPPVTNGTVVVDGITYARTDVGIQAAVNAAPSGGKVELPVATYIINGTITITKPLDFICAGWGALLQVAASVGATTDVILVQPTALGGTDGVRIQDCHFAPISGTPGRAAIHLSGSSGNLNHILIDHVKVEKLGGNAILADGSGLAQGTPVLTTIQHSALFGGISMPNAGDTVRILNNQLTGAGAGLDVSFQVGASTLLVKGNNISSDGGIHIGTAAVSTQIVENEIESFTTFTGSNGALVDIDGLTTSRAADVVIARNSVQVVNSITANGVRVNFADRTQIYGNRFSRGLTTSKDILITANGDRTFVGNNGWASGLPFSSMLSDLGTNTVVATGLSGAFVVNTLANSIAGSQPITVPSLGAADTMVVANAAQTLTNKTATGASNGNNITLLNAQANAAAITGTGAAATVYTYTLPASTVANLKGVRVRASLTHSTGTAVITYILSLNGVTVETVNSSSGSANIFDSTILNTGTTTGTQTSSYLNFNFTNSSAVAGTLTGLAWTSSQVLTLTFNVANTDAVTPIQWLVELIQ